MMIHFIRPMWLLMLLPLIIYLLWLMIATKQKNPWQDICDPHLLPALMQEGPKASQHLFYTTLLILFTLMTFALAGPSFNKVKLPIYRDVSSVMLVLDLSPAMLSTDLTPDRLSRAKFKIRDLINAAQNTQMGLVVFSGEAFVAAPLSQDANTLKAMLDELHPRIMPLAGVDIGEGLMQGLDLLKQSQVTHSTLLLITGNEPSASSWAAAKAIASAGDQLDILAMVSPNEANKNTITTLERLAKAGHGTMTLFTADATDMKNILNNITTKQAVKDEEADNVILWKDAGPWFCLLLLPFALFVLREKVRYEKSH